MSVATLWTRCGHSKRSLMTVQPRTMAASKEWHIRASWSLDDLVDAMAKHFGYADRTGLIKSLIRGCALVGRNSNHAMLLRLSHEPPAVQDKIDAELCRMWKERESIAEGPMKKLAEKIAAQTGRAPNTVLKLTAEQIIERARRNNGSGE